MKIATRSLFCEPAHGIISQIILALIGQRESARVQWTLMNWNKLLRYFMKWCVLAPYGVQRGAKETYSREQLLLEWDGYGGLLNKLEKMSYTIHYGVTVMGFTWSRCLRGALVCVETSLCLSNCQVDLYSRLIGIPKICICSSSRLIAGVGAVTGGQLSVFPRGGRE